MNQDSEKDDNLSESKKKYEYFEAHTCCLPKNKVSEYEIKCNRFRLFVLSLTTAQTRDTRTLKLYLSYAALCEDKYRQYKFYPYSIHPYSKITLWLQLFFVFILLLTTVLMAVHYSATNPNKNFFLRNNMRSRNQTSHSTYFGLYDLLIFWTIKYDLLQTYLKIILLCTDLIYLFNIFINFFTGYVEGCSCKIVVFDWKKILMKYSGSWLLLDLMSIGSILPNIFQTNAISLELILGSMRVFRVPKHYFYIKNLLKLTTHSKMNKELVTEITFLLLSYLFWNIYFQFAIEYIFEDTFTPTSPRACSWVTIGKLWDKPSDVRFVYALDRAVGMLRGNANLNMLEEDSCFDIYFMVAWFISKVLVLHCTFQYIIAILGSESSRSNYFIMTQQVEMYLNQRKFPPRIKKKILKFYSIRFFSHFFVENRMMSCVSGQLKEDIIMHTGRQLVHDVAFLKQLPGSLLLEIGIKLRIVIYITGDIIMKINTIGDCLYLIHKGTVAIYSESGKEVCHLEDGDFFGEIALIMKHRLRTASAVAVTNCELFQLDRKDFEGSVASYPTVYEDIKKVATNRLERTSVLDEHHKAEMKMKSRNRKERKNYQI